MSSCVRLRSILLCLMLLVSAPLVAQETYINIRMINLIPDGPSINFHLNSSGTPPLKAPVPFRGASDPVIMQTLGTAGVYFTDATTNAELYSTNVDLANNTRRNIVLIGTMGSIQSRILSLTIPPPTESPDADVRFFNGSPDGGAVDLKITEADGATRTVTNLAFGANTEFLSLAPGMTRVEAFAAGTQNLLFNVQGIVRAGFFYTAFVTGMADDLQLRLMIESDQRAQLPMTRWTTPPPTNDAELRLVNLSNEGTAIDIYMDGVRKVSEVIYGATSAVSGIPSGSRTFAFVRAGESLDQAFHTETVTVAPRTSISAVVMGTPPSPVTVRMFVRSTEEVIAAGQTKARVLLANTVPAGIDIVLRDTAGTELRVTNAQPTVASDFMTLGSGPVTVEIGLTGQAPGARYLGFLPSGGVATIVVWGAPGNVGVSVLVETDPSVRQPLIAFTRAGEGAYRFVHVAPATPEIEMAITGSQPATQTLAFGEAGEGFGRVFAGPLPVIVRAGTQPLLAENVEIAADTLTTAFLVGTPGALELVEVPTAAEDIAIEAGKAHVRFFIGAPIEVEWRVEIITANGARRTFDSLTFRDVTPYIEVPAGSIDVAIFGRGSTTPIARLTGTVASEQVVTLIAATFTTEGTPVVQVLDDAAPGEQAPMPVLTLVASVRPVDTRRVELSIAPNPARSDVRVEYAPSVAGEGRILLYDMTGRRRADVATTGDAVSTRSASIATSTLESGVYNVVLVEGDGSTSGAGVLQIAR